MDRDSDKLLARITQLEAVLWERDQAGIMNNLRILGIEQGVKKLEKANAILLEGLAAVGVHAGALAMTEGHDRQFLVAKVLQIVELCRYVAKMASDVCRPSDPSGN